MMVSMRRPITHPPVPATDDRAIDARGRVWHLTHHDPDPCVCLWQIDGGAFGATWALLCGGYGHNGRVYTFTSAQVTA